MNAEKQTVEKSPNPAQNPFIRKTAIYAAVLLVVFLLGFVSVWLTARNRVWDLAETRRQLKLAQMRNRLASAVIDARRGEYVPARQSAGDFFTSLRAEMERDFDSILTQAQRESISPLVSQRDDLITLLSHSDPASADRLSNFYLSYPKAVGGS